MSRKLPQPSLFEEEPIAGEGQCPASTAVLVPYPVDKAYDYALPDGIGPVEPGAYVSVPLGGRSVPGVVWGDADGTVSRKKLKQVEGVFVCPPMPEAHRVFLDRVARYTMSARGSVLKMAIPVPKALDPPEPVKAYKIRDSYFMNVLPSPQPSPHRGEGGAALAAEGEGAPCLVERSRELRRNQTDVEKKLWFVLKNRQLMNLKFRRQHPVGPYIPDFACLEKKLIIELDGGQHDEQKEYDQERTLFLEGQGYKVLRFWNNEILENIDGVLEKIAGEAQKNSLLSGLSPQRRKVIDALSDGRARRPAEIARLAGCSASVVKGMADQGLLEPVELSAPAPCCAPDPERQGPALSTDQKAAADILCSYIGNGFHTALLDGVTGAGKTEVYFEAVAEALKAEKQVLILLPEIALSNAFLDRFTARFGCAPALWHSALTLAQRRDTWRGVAEGHTKVVIGARSALFLPYPDLGLIIVDEEHDPAYKQEEGVMYHARDMAVLRAHVEQIPVVLVSATPALETMCNVWDGKYEHICLPDRFGGARLPDIDLIDLRSDKPERGEFIAPSLRTAVEETLEAGEQALLFLNRRGYAPLTLCRTCGHRMECPRCTAWLVEHRRSNRLHCHHCGFSSALPERCPECGESDCLAACGPGVERIAEEAKLAFPEARILVLASDTAENDEALRGMLEDIHARKVDIIIGTQIIAKGHHFPNLTLVGVIDADLGLQGGELRGAERVYQLLHQVAGRAGRAEKKGHVYLQTFMPEHRIMKALAAGARDAFLELEAGEREAAHMPPFSRLAGIIVSGRDEGQVVETAKALGQSAPQGEKVQTFGPAPAPFARLRGKFRYRLLVRADKGVDLPKTLKGWIAGVKHPSTVRIQADIDPQSFL